MKKEYRLLLFFHCVLLIAGFFLFINIYLDDINKPDFTFESNYQGNITMYESDVQLLIDTFEKSDNEFAYCFMQDGDIVKLVEPIEVMYAEKNKIKFSCSKNYIGNIHSHPSGAFKFSYSDIRDFTRRNLQYKNAKYFGIIWGNTINHITIINIESPSLSDAKMQLVVIPDE